MKLKQLINFDLIIQTPQIILLFSALEIFEFLRKVYTYLNF